MSETRVLRRSGRFTKVEGFTCQECGVWGPYGEVHTWLFCQLHKLGWSRETIVANVEFTANALSVSRETPR